MFLTTGYGEDVAGESLRLHRWPRGCEETVPSAEMDFGPDAGLAYLTVEPVCM